MGLEGKNIPVTARIISIADAYDAMTNDRPYRKAYDKEYAIKELLKNSGKQFDPVLVKKFISIITAKNTNFSNNKEKILTK